MTLALAALLGLVQALTEFLPVSSSGHLVIFQRYVGPLFGVASTPLAFDVLVHFATLLATVAYFWADIWRVLCNLVAAGEVGQWARRLALLVIVATVPAAVVGLGFRDAVEALFHSIDAVSLGLLITTALLLFAHRRQCAGATAAATPSAATWQLPTLYGALLIGVFQALAIMPGVSRSGSTIAAGLLFGLPVDSAIRFSFLLSLPAILGATLLESPALIELGQAHFTAYLAGFATALVGGLAAMSLLVTLTRGAKLIYFALYTALVSAGLLLFG